MRPRARAAQVQPVQLRVSDLAAEAFDAIAARPGRAMLTVLGTLLGTAAFVAVLGITTTASQQISAAFTAQVATQVTVTDHPSDQGATLPFPFPEGTEARLHALHGVTSAGIFWTAGPGAGQTATQVATIPPSLAVTQPVPLGVTAATPGYLAAIGARVSEGRLYDQFHQDTAQPVCVLGADAARSLGLTDLNGSPAVFIDGTPLIVIGIIGSSSYQQDAAISNVFVPTSLAISLWGDPQPQTNPASVFITTALGAANQVGAEAPYAINPQDPGRYQVTVPPDPNQQLGAHIDRNLTELFYALAGISLLIGTAGIANTTLVAVLERVKEIGLRRTFGASRAHILAQFLAEAAALGLSGGIAGAALGAWAVVAVADAHRWTAVISPLALIPAPLVGAVTGLVAGVYPAWRASRIEPVEALRA